MEGGWIGAEEGGWEDRSKKRQTSGRRAINKKTKKTIVFDPEARRRFLTGFRKRKQERKEKYQEKLGKDLAEEKRKMKEEAKVNVAKKQSSSHSIIPEVEHLLESSSEEEDENVGDEGNVYHIGATTVSISSLNDKLFSNHHHHHLVKEDEDDEEEGGQDFLTYKGPEGDSDSDSYANANAAKTSAPTLDRDALKLRRAREALRNPGAIAKQRETDTLVKKEANRLLQHSAIYKKTLRMKQQGSKKFRLNRLTPKEENTEEGSGSKIAGAKGGGKKHKKNKFQKVKTKGRPAK